MNLHHKEHRLITIVGVILVVLVVIFGLFILNPLNLADQMVAISMNLLVIALILILTGFLVEVKYKMEEQKNHFLRTEKLLAERLRITDVRPKSYGTYAEEQKNTEQKEELDTESPLNQAGTEKENIGENKSKKTTKSRTRKKTNKKKKKKSTKKSKSKKKKS